MILTESIEAIQKISKGGFWDTRSYETDAPVGNMAPRHMRENPGKITVTEDIIAERKLTEEEFQLLINSCKDHEKLAFYIEQGPFGFYPVFSVILYDAPLLQGWNGDKPITPLIKWKVSNVPCTEDKLVEIAYSEENQAKLKKFGKKLEKYSQYDY